MSSNTMKGVLICGGRGTRLAPLTEVTNKSLLPIYDKPLIHFPLDTLRSAGLEEIMIVSGNEHLGQMANYLGSGNKFGCKFTFKVQDEPKGIAQALSFAEEFAEGESICAILGDNIFFDDLSEHIRSFESGGRIFVKEVQDPERFGVVELDEDNVLSIEEKPEFPKSNLISTGCYVYDNRCFDIIRGLKPSHRDQLEITDVSDWYIKHGELKATILQDEWIDAGTFESLHEASVLARERKV